MNAYKHVDELSLLRGKCWRVYFKMLSESAKNSGMYCAITSTSVENEDVEFSMKTVAIFGPGWYVSVYY